MLSGFLSQICAPEGAATCTQQKEHWGPSTADCNNDISNQWRTDTGWEGGGGSWQVGVRPVMARRLKVLYLNYKKCFN